MIVGEREPSLYRVPAGFVVHAIGCRSLLEAYGEDDSAITLPCGCPARNRVHEPEAE